MGQKINPIGFRLAVSKDWRSKWYASGKDYTDKLHEDLRIRRYIRKRLQFAALSRIVIERAWASVRVTLHTSRPGLIIGRKGAEIEAMTKDLSKLCKEGNVKIDIVEIRKPELDAQLVAEQVAVQLERRISFRRAMKRAVQTTMDFGADGIRIRCAGRLGGADIARAEWYREGKVPLQTLRVPLDYGFAEARTVYGIIGVKCWVNKTEEAEKSPGPQRERRPPRRPQGPRNDGPGGGGGGDNRPPRGDGGSPAPGPAPKTDTPSPAPKTDTPAPAPQA
jgi:small subunit ribosomal protein S3